MKNRFIISLLLAVSSATCTGQDYFSEVKNIVKINKLIRSLFANGAPTVSLDNNGGIVMSQNLVEVLRGVSASTRAALTTDAFQNAVPAPGGITQPGVNLTVLERPVLDSNGIKKNTPGKVPSIDSSIFNELKYLSFLCFNTSQPDYENALLLQHFPSHFEYLDKIILALQQYSNKQLEAAGTFQSDRSAFGSNFAFSESAIIFGITDWAIRQAKQELMNVYIDNWYKKLNQNDLIRPVIPQSLKVYEAFRNDNALNLAKYGDKWKAAFQEDLRNIPVLLQKDDYVKTLFKAMKIDEGTDLYKELLPVITGGDELIYNLYLKKHLVTVLSNMANRYNRESNTDFPIFKRCVIMANLMATVCGQMQDNKYVPVSIETIRKMDIGGWAFFFKLLLLRNSDVLQHALNEKSPEFIAKIVFRGEATAAEVSQVFEETVSIIGAYQNMLSNATAAAKEISFEDVRKLFDLDAQLFDNVSGFLDLSKHPNVQNLVEQYKQKVRPFVNYLSELGEGVSTKQYGKVLDGAISIIRFADELKNPGKPELNSTVYDLQRYGSFMVNILTAQNSGAVETALDELIPKGQYQLKNKKKFTASLSVYPGVFAGAEQISKYDTDNSGNPITSKKKLTSTRGSLAFYLPIGIDLNFGYETKNSASNKTATPEERKYASNSIFIQALDLGAVLNYRLTASGDSTEQSEPEVKFKQLFSPGIGLMHHFNNSPVVLGLGLNYTPGLRTLKQKSTTYSSNALRFGIFASVDVTALLLHVSKQNAH